MCVCVRVCVCVCVRVCVCVHACMLLSLKKTSCDSISMNETGTTVCETILHISLHLIASFYYLSKVHTQISVHELMKYCCIMVYCNCGDSGGGSGGGGKTKTEGWNRLHTGCTCTML